MIYLELRQPSNNVIVCEIFVNYKIFCPQKKQLINLFIYLRVSE